MSIVEPYLPGFAGSTLGQINGSPASDLYLRPRPRQIAIELGGCPASTSGATRSEPAFSVFFMQSPSFLAHQRHLADGHGHGRSNCETLFGMTRIPSDNHIRDMLDPVEPASFDALFPHAVAVLEAGGGLPAFRRLGHHVLIAFDGTEYYRSTKLHCSCCSTRKRSGGGTEYFHTLVAATLVAPGHNRVCRHLR